MVSETAIRVASWTRGAPLPRDRIARRFAAIFAIGVLAVGAYVQLTAFLLGIAGYAIVFDIGFLWIAIYMYRFLSRP